MKIKAPYVMGSKRRKNENIVNKCILRQVRGGIPFNAQFPRSFLQTKLDLTRLCIPLCDIQKDNSFAVGHVLLGFTKSGEYLMSYYKELQDDVSFGLPMYKYTLHWWKFNLRRPLQEVCHISLFVGEVITEDLLLIVCHTLNDNRILVHGYAYPGRDEQCRQCYVTICPSPPGTCAISPNDTWVVHMKYNLLPPFPLFIPLIQLKLQDTVVLNTVDSVLAITVCPCTQHKTPEHNFRHQNCGENSSANHRETKTNFNGLIADSEVDILENCVEKSPVSVKEVDTKLSIKDSKESRDESKICAQETTKDNVLNSKDRVEQSSKEVKANIPCKDAHRKTEDNADSLSTKCSSNSPGICCDKNTLTKTLNCDYSIITNLVNNNQEIDIDTHDDIGCNGVGSFMSVNRAESPINIPKSSHLSSFSFKTFSIGTHSKMVEDTEDTSTSTHIDGTSYLDIQINTVANTPYKLFESLQDSSEMKDHSSPCVHTRVVSLDVERYINEALNTSDELKGKYWLLRNYSTLLVDVCEGSQRVIIHIVILISVQDDNEKPSKRKICSFSLLATWSISTGEVRTLNISPFNNSTVAKTDKQVFKEGCKKVADLHKKYSVPSGLSAVQAFSNHNIFTGKTLQFIKHPFQPIAIVL